MRRVIIVVLVIYLVGGMLIDITTAGENGSDGYIYLKVEKSKVEVNEEFWLKVYVKTNRTIGASQFSILYNPSVIKIKEVKLSSINHNAIMQTKINSGYLKCGVITVQGIKSGELMVIKAVGLKSGKSEFKINLEEVVDVNGSPLDFSVGLPIQLSVYVASSSTSTSATMPVTSTADTGTSQSISSTSPYYTQKNASKEKSATSPTTSSESTLTLPGLPTQSKSSPAGHHGICGPAILIAISLLSLICYRVK